MKHDICVDIDDGTGIIEAVKDMISKGRRKILILSYS